MNSSKPQVPDAAVTSFEENELESIDVKMKNETDGQEKTSSSEELTEEEMMYCKYCEYQAPNLKSYTIHVIRPSHVKKVADSYNIKMNKDTTPRIYDCPDCLISCNGENAWRQHLLGQKHRKVLEKKSMALAAVSNGGQFGGGGPIKQNPYTNFNKKPYDRNQKMVRQPNNSPSEALGAKDFATYSEPLIGLEYVTEIQVIGQSPRYHCTLCETKFDHNLKFPHLVGAKHRMNVLKTKRPAAIEACRAQTQKRSELTAMLLQEARKLEKEEGRQKVKTKVEKGASSSTVPLMGAPGRGRAGSRGNRGNRGANSGYQGTSSYRGGSSRGARGAARGQHTQYYNDHGQAAGSGYGYNYPGPPSDFLGQSNIPYNEHFDNYMSSLTSSSYPSLLGSAYPAPPPLHDGYAPARRGDYGTQQPVNEYSPRSYAGAARDYPSYSSQNNDNFYDSPAGWGPAGGGGSAGGGGGGSQKPEGGKKPDVSTGLATALGDLTKLVQNEEDASVALSVSNALTQALLKYRMTGLQDEGGASD